ncbi:Creatinase/aminopeptidase [Ceraceosorus guamensis]|uniref:Creatinase/aminopeptidase n=1 Tax=Ceraceosorus guamensis TaxID=1522189 RepID=A0A316W6U6_9BASI|nr:Creatinase/aminopeptidase [Ceraceosorus guamensis]PWN45512.1 Creatinase/aminopeptidase [Ceraceosorus guamensis]
MASCLPSLRFFAGRRADEKYTFDDTRSSSASTLVEDKASHSLSEPNTYGTLKVDNDVLKSKRFSSRDTKTQLDALRRLMKEEGIKAYIIPSEDAHGSEYTAKTDERRAFISGFTGSTGIAVVTLDGAHLFTDGRYHVQAQEQLDSNWTLHKVGVYGVSDWADWLVDEASKETIAVGVDATLVSFTTLAALLPRLTSRDSSLQFPTRNLVDEIWRSRPPPNLTHIYAHPLKYAGVTAGDKLTRVVEWLKSKGAAGDGQNFSEGSAFFTAELDQIAWLLNLRGASIPGSPLFPAYLVVSSKSSGSTGGYLATLFVSSLLLLPGSDARKCVESLGVEVKDYADVFPWLLQGRWRGSEQPGKVDSDDQARPTLVAGEKVSYAVVNAVGEHRVILLRSTPIAIWKACKNEAELAGMRAAYLRDGASWARWAAWLDEAVRRRHRKVDEWQAAQQLRSVREKDPLYAGFDAYPSISASAEDAALPHFETPEDGSARVIDRLTPYLMDSGGQYFDGTIDTTRTVHFGRPTSEQKRAFTRVLQGHIAIQQAVFPRGTTGATLDCLARQPLWRDGYNYLHGTGHGIGAFGNVHEGPQGFSQSSGGALIPVPLEEGMCISDEPGHYEAGKGGFGIRTESILIVKKAKTHRGFGGEDTWLKFENITQVPIARNLVEHQLLTPNEQAWLTEHNEKVKRNVLPLVADDKRAIKWLQSQ